MLYNFTVTHKDQSTTTGGPLDLTPPGNSQVIVVSVPCLCGTTHQLTGTQAANSNSISGSGANSVAPPNDPRAGKPPGGGQAYPSTGTLVEEEPSWNGSPGSPDPEE